MNEPDDATAPERPDASAPAGARVATGATGCASPAVDGPPDDRAMRRAALRDLAAMIGVEVFY